MNTLLSQQVEPSRKAALFTCKVWLTAMNMLSVGVQGISACLHVWRPSTMLDSCVMSLDGSVYVAYSGCSTV